PSVATLQGQVSDDGNPNPPGQLSITWTRVDGPGTVNFTNPNGAVTQASFAIAGTYRLRLTVSDSVLSTSDDVVIIANGAANQAPTVSAGVDKIINLPETITLIGTASDDGLPSGTLTVLWSKVSGSGAISFSNATNLATVVTFVTPGIYVLRLTATDSQLSSSDDVQVVVNPEPITPLLCTIFGFEPETIEIAPGIQKIFIRNRTGLDGLVYKFSNSSGVITQVVVDSGQDKFVEIEFVVGAVTLTVEQYEWSCQIVVVP
ncbi:MAG: PA14 domain-containing protein, partial [bacterium]